MTSNSKLVILLFLVFGSLFGTGDNVKAACVGGIPDGTADILGGEECDGGDLDGEDCNSQGYSGGILNCTGTCAFDFSDCCGQDPTVVITPASTSGEGGEIRNYNLGVTNNDSIVAGCAARDFALILTGLPDPCPDPTLHWEWDLGTIADALATPPTLVDWDSAPSGVVNTGNIGPGVTLGIPFIVMSCDSYTPIHTETFTITASEGGNSGTDTGDYVISSTVEICDNGVDTNGDGILDTGDDDGDGDIDCDDADCLGHSNCCGNGTMEGAEICDLDAHCSGLTICNVDCSACVDPLVDNECAANYDDCDCDITTGTNGCETNLLTDTNNCGMCGNVCVWGCENGACMEPSGGLVPCGRYANDPITPWNEEEPCNICHLIILIDSVTGYLLGIIGIITVLSLVIGGMLYVTSSGNSNLVTTAKTAFRKSLYGFVIVFIAWVMTNTTMVLFGFDDPLGDGSWHKFNCEVSTSISDLTYCGDGIVQITGNGDGQIEECDFKETKITYLLRNPGHTALDWVKTVYSCNPVDCILRCQNPLLQAEIGLGCYLDLDGDGVKDADECQKGRMICDIVDQDDPTQDDIFCVDVYNDEDYRMVGFSCKARFDYCCEDKQHIPEYNLDNMIAATTIIRGPSGNFDCDDICRDNGQICIGVGLRDIANTKCSYLVHNLGNTCQLSANLASANCDRSFVGGSGFCRETFGFPTWSMGRGETACYCQ